MHLRELEELEANLSDIEDLEADLSEAKGPRLISV
jgi:hypothetical protein